MRGVRTGGAPLPLTEPSTSGLSQLLTRAAGVDFAALLEPVVAEQGKAQARPGEPDKRAAADKSPAPELPLPEQASPAPASPESPAPPPTRVVADPVEAQQTPPAIVLGTAGSKAAPPPEQVSVHGHAEPKQSDAEVKRNPRVERRVASADVPAVTVQSTPVVPAPSVPDPRTAPPIQTTKAAEPSPTRPEPVRPEAETANPGEPVIIASAAATETPGVAKVDRRAKVDDQSIAIAAPAISAGTADRPGPPPHAAVVAHGLAPSPIAAFNPRPDTGPGISLVVSVPAVHATPTTDGTIALPPVPGVPHEAQYRPTDAPPTPPANVTVAAPANTQSTPQDRPAAPTPAPLANTPGEQVALHVAHALTDGGKTVTVELHPAELGRVEIRFSFHADGMNVRMTLDRPETFDAFSRDRSGLEQQLARAGVDLGGGGLDLRLGQPSDQPESYSSGRTPRVAPLIPPAAAAATTLWVGNGLLDILA